MHRPTVGRSRSLVAAGLVLGSITLDGRPAALNWGALLLANLVFVSILRLIGLPAALLLGSIAAAALLASFGGRVRIPAWSFVLAESVVGCLIAKAIGSASITEMVRQRPVFLSGVLAVMAFGAALGVLMARWKVLPGTTAIWGSSPGGATAMVLMAEAYGADIRLVAVMQYLRVAIVGLLASVVARTFGVAPAAPAATEWFPALAPGPFLATLALVVGGAAVGVKWKTPAGALLAPMFAGVVLSAGHLLAITLPPWLLAASYALIGWSIGLRFTRPVIAYAARQLPRITASILALIALCGALAYGLHLVEGADALTAYLATSPGGADSVAIIAASSKVDLPFVMAMQITRAIVAILVGPSLARVLAGWLEPRPRKCAEHAEPAMVSLPSAIHQRIVSRQRRAPLRSRNVREPVSDAVRLAIRRERILPDSQRAVGLVELRRRFRPVVRLNSKEKRRDCGMGVGRARGARDRAFLRPAFWKRARKTIGPRGVSAPRSAAPRSAPSGRPLD